MRRLFEAYFLSVLVLVFLTNFTVNTRSLGAANAPKKIGIVLMHGKSGTNGPLSPVGILKTDLEGAGYAVITPELPWSRERRYAEEVEAAFTEIDQAVRWLKSQGVQKIVIAGHSLGANIAIAYGALRTGLAGIVAIAPGHVPDSKKWRKLFAADVAKAKKMIAHGRGAEFSEFTDRNQGRVTTVRVRANIYHGYFDPEGQAGMSNTVSRLKPHSSVLWIIEDARKGKFAGRKMYEKIAKGVRRHFVIIDSTHADAPQMSAVAITSWLKKL